MHLPSIRVGTVHSASCEMAQVLFQDQCSDSTSPRDRILGSDMSRYSIRLRLTTGLLIGVRIVMGRHYTVSNWESC